MKTKRKYIPFYTFLILLIIATPFESGLRIENSGWNSKIATTSVLEIIVWTIIAFISFIYWKLSKKIDKVNSNLPYIHIALTIPMVLYARLNLVIRQIAAKNSNDVFELINNINTILYSVLTFFLIGQILFLIICLKIRNLKNEGLG